jgi:hypothetical protein
MIKTSVRRINNELRAAWNRSLYTFSFGFNTKNRENC